MAKRSVYLHVGPALPAVEALHEALQEALQDHPALAGAGVLLPAVDQDLMDRADVEIRRRHKALGLRRKDVEGSWAKVCRKAFKARSDVLITQPGFVGATTEQAALAVDGLVGMRIHIVLTPAVAPEPAALADLVGPWAGCAKPSRIHVLPVGAAPTAVDLGTGLAGLAVRARAADAERRLAKRNRQRRGVAA